MSFKPKLNSIHDDYEILKEVLGTGINGRVYSVIRKTTGQKYAIKTLNDSSKTRREIDLQWRACQNCSYIVQIYDVYENIIRGQKCIFLVMEHMGGGELFAKIKSNKKLFTEQEVAKMMFQICSAVKHLHSMNIAHRDLKPENLLLTSNDEEAVIKLTDFGFAKEASSGLITPCYTPYYVAPEVLGSAVYDKSCDIWSLGVILYILCCGYPPFYSTHGQPISPGMKKRIRAGEYRFPDSEWSQISNEVKQLIQGMLEPIAEKRLTIENIINSNWISNYFEVPLTPLPSVLILNEENDEWHQVTETIHKTLDEMRVKDKCVDLDLNKNKLLAKRRDKKTIHDQVVRSPSVLTLKSVSMEDLDSQCNDQQLE